MVPKRGRLVEDDVVREHGAFVPNPLGADQARAAVCDEKPLPRAAELIAQGANPKQHIVGRRLRVADAVPQ
jgi:hypothetical protein